jgi:hypothetical protein
MPYSLSSSVSEVFRFVKTLIHSTFYNFSGTSGFCVGRKKALGMSIVWGWLIFADSHAGNGAFYTFVKQTQQLDVPASLHYTICFRGKDLLLESSEYYPHECR